WVFDRSPLYRFEWAKRWAGDPRRIVNLHTGFDETSHELARLFPEAELMVLDLYDPDRMTEASIQRAHRYQARRGISPLPATRVTHDALPAADDSVDALFSILAVHEVRRPEDRRRLFEEIRRCLRPGGRLLLLEHLRDPANFLAFGPQF